MTIPNRGDLSGLTPNTNAQAKLELEDMLDALRQAPGSLPWQEIEIASGAITPAVGSSCLLSVKAAGGMSDDDLTTINEGTEWTSGKILVLRGWDVNHSTRPNSP
jgi:hypothetical protein